jgi:hypothetical protein
MHERYDRARDDVFAGFENAADVFDGFEGSNVGGRRIANAIRIEREDGVDVARRPQADRSTAAELAGVFARLGVAVHAHAD